MQSFKDPQMCAKPFSQPWDAAGWEEEHAGSSWKKLRLWELWKGFASSTKINLEEPDKVTQPNLD